MLAILLAGCASAPVKLPPTSTSAPTSTATSTPTATAILLPTATATPKMPRTRGGEIATKTPPPSRRGRPRPTSRPDPLAPLRALVRESAARRVGEAFRGDCSAFVLRAYRDAGIAVEVPGAARSGSEGLFRASVPVERPRPGDLAFFHDTYDRNRDGRLGDRFTHVAMVESVKGSSVVLVHRGSRGVRRLRMDLSRPADGKANDRLRVARAGDAPGTRLLAGQLFAAYGQLLGGEFTQMLPASRAGDTPLRQARSR